MGLNSQSAALTVIASIGFISASGDSAPNLFIPFLIEMYKQGRFLIQRLCTVFSIDDFSKAITEMRLGNVIKPVLDWSK